MVPLRLNLRWSCLCVLLSLWALDVCAQEAPQPQVLFSFDRNQAESASPSADNNHTALSAPQQLHRVESESSLAPLPQPIVYRDSAVVPATQTSADSAVPPVKDSRRLAPQVRSDPAIGERSDASPRRQLPFELPKMDSLGTAATGLVLVVGLFLLCVSLMRRSGPSPTTPLPRDAVAMLGRIPLAPKQFAHLLQVGNKLVLVSISPDRTDTITEVTEPAEVDRLLALCMKGSKQSTSAEFQRMLQQMAKEPTRGFLGNEAASTYSRSARG